MDNVLIIVAPILQRCCSVFCKHTNRNYKRYLSLLLFLRRRECFISSVQLTADRSGHCSDNGPCKNTANEVKKYRRKDEIVSRGPAEMFPNFRSS